MLFRYPLPNELGDIKDFPGENPVENPIKNPMENPMENPRIFLVSLNYILEVYKITVHVLYVMRIRLLCPVV